ncbi:MAG: DNA modification methylase [Chlorobi bacterium]|nr:DNA modification methylase [Chlorobiota bacterium]
MKGKRGNSLDARKKEFQKNFKQKVREQVRKRGIENISSILQEARNEYLNEIVKYGISDGEQSWKTFKGNLIEEIIKDEIEEAVMSLGLQIIKGSKLEGKDENIGECLSQVKRYLSINYGGNLGLHLPDADLVIYDAQECKPIAIISIKATLRERIAQTGYWSLKLKQSPITKRVKSLFITLDEDGDLIRANPVKKGRAIAEVDIDATYVIRNDVPQSANIKHLSYFKDDLHNWLRQ